jgi:hypothetical protein
MGIFKNGNKTVVMDGLVFRERTSGIKNANRRTEDHSKHDSKIERLKSKVNGKGRGD